MGNLTHTVGGTDNLVSFKSAARVPIDSLKVHFSPIQEGEGDPSPENIRPISGWDGIEQFYSGKNIGHVVGYSASSTTSPSSSKKLNGFYGNTISTTDPEESVTITQTQWPESLNLSSYKNGYFAIVVDNLIFDNYYDISFKISNITNNPLNASLSNLKAAGPSATKLKSPIVNNDILIFKNIQFKQHTSVLSIKEFYVYYCGMSFTLSEFMVTPAGMNDGIFEPYTPRRLVNWNQWLPPLTAENWQAYNSNNIDVTFEDGIATSTWLTNNIGYSASVIPKVGILQKSKDIWYVSYMIKTSKNNSKWGVEFNGGIQTTPIDNLDANIWGRCSDQAIFWKSIRNYVYISNYKDSADNDHIGMTAQVKSPIFINLTQMFGPGNEPTKEEFEEQCVLNGIDLTSALPYDECSVREWKTNGKLLKNNITFPVLGKNKFNVNAPFAEPSDTTPVTSTLRIFQPYTYCLGLNGSNNYNPSMITNFSNNNNTITFTSNKNYGVAFSIPSLYGTYILSYTGENISFKFIKYDSSGKIIYDGMTQTNNTTFSIGKNVAITTIIFIPITANTTSTIANIQIEEGTTATEYEEFNPNHTVYGGYVDLAKGELVSTYLHCKIKDLPGEWSYRSGNNRFQITLSSYFANAPSSGGIWTHFATSEVYKTSTSNGYGNKQIATYINKHIYIRDDDFEGDVDAFLNSVGDTYITYELAEPIHYSLTPHQLTTFLNTNNFWSNTNGPTEISYAIHDSEQIRSARKRILAAAPKIKEASGSIATFNTDISAQLKECKAYFSPVQEGEGDPSPENVRAISGFEEIKLLQCKENLWNKETATPQYVNAASVLSASDANNLTSDWIEVIPNKTYIYSYQPIIGANISGSYSNLWTGAGFYRTQSPSDTATARKVWTAPSSVNVQQIEITIPENCYYIRIGSRHLNIDGAWACFEPYEESQITSTLINWTTEAGTVYGGYVDLIKGELVYTWAYVDLGDLTWSYVGSPTSGPPYFLANLTGKKLGYKNLISSHLTVGSKASTTNLLDCNIIGSTAAARVFVRYDTITNASDFTTAVTGMTIAYELDTPVTYTLIPQFLKSLIGTNNIWSNANGNIELKYWTH